MNSDNFNTRLTLMEKIRNRHNEEAWDDFCHYYSPYIKSICRRMLSTQADVEDCTQIILLNLWRDLPGFNLDHQKGRFRSWLVTICRNKVYTYLQKGRRENEKVSALALEETLPQNQFVKMADEEWRRYIAEFAWDNISSQFNEQFLAIFRRALEGISNKQIAEEMNLKVNTVAVYKKRVRTALHQEMIRLKGELE